MLLSSAFSSVSVFFFSGRTVDGAADAADLCTCQRIAEPAETQRGGTGRCLRLPRQEAQFGARAI